MVLVFNITSCFFLKIKKKASYGRRNLPRKNGIGYSVARTSVSCPYFDNIVRCNVRARALCPGHLLPTCYTGVLPTPGRQRVSFRERMPARLLTYCADMCVIISCWGSPSPQRTPPQVVAAVDELPGTAMLFFSRLLSSSVM